MTNYSRTTLRELKKRYLNILKKCLLANLLAFSFCLPAGATVFYINDSSGQSSVDSDSNGLLSYLQNENYKVTTIMGRNFDDIQVDGTIIFTHKNKVTGNGGILTVLGNMIFNPADESDDATVIFSNGLSTSTGSAFYNFNSTVTFNTDVIIQNNSGAGAIYSRGNLIFNKNALFGHETDSSLGNKNGAIFNYQKVTFAPNSKAVFSYNTGTEGAAVNNSVYLPSNNIGNMTFYDVDFKNNTVTNAGGALFTNQSFSYKDGVLTKISSETIFKGNTLFESNQANNGGAIYNWGKIIFDDTSTVKFINNTSLKTYGGAIYNVRGYVAYLDENNKTQKLYDSDGNLVYDTGEIIFNGVSYFKGNSVEYNGGAINNQGSLIFNNTAEFISNSSKSQGGAIWNNNELIFELGSKSIFTGNKSSLGAGLLNSSIDLKNHGTIVFNDETFFLGNIAYENDFLDNTKGRGGGIYQVGGKITFNHDFTFAGNKANKGKDIYIDAARTNSTIDINGNSKTVGIIEGGIAGTIGRTYGFIPQINKTGAGLLVLGDNSENHEYEGTFTQTAGVTIANSERFFSHEKAVNTINGGELKTHGSAIAYQATLGHAVDEETGSVLSSGTLTHLGTSADTSTEVKGVSFNGTGLNLTLGTYTKAEQEKEISLVGDRIVEYVDDKGTEDTADDELVSYQATDKLFTVNALENDQKAKFILNENLTGMNGNSITVAGAELDVKEGLKVAGKVVAKDMRLPAEKNSSFTALEVAEKGLLDIQNQTVTVDTLSLNQEGSVKVSVHSLSDYGQILAKETVSKGAGTLTMNLVGAPQEGVYKVFEQDTDLKLATTHEFLDITDLENGSYKIARKKTDELAEKFGLNEEETRAVSAVIDGNAENEAFQKVQSEIMEKLKSGNKGKAKKALKAVGSKEHPIEQSVASEHLVALQNVVQAELHGAGVGRAGGEEDPRAKVYIKGLYDRTKSSMGEGFRARSKGAVLGVQSEVTDTLTLGVGYATSQTTAKEDLRRTEVDTNTGFISAHYQPNAWWVSGLATFSRGEYEEEKQILSSVGKASYNVDSWGAQVMTGYDIKLENAIITPEVGLRYLSVKQEGYTDTLGTTVSGTRSDYLTALVGVKGTWDMGAIRPTAGVTVGYDIISDDVSALNTLANGASYTVNGEALDRLSTTLTTGIEADLGDRTTLKLEYSGTFRKEYADHSGMLKLEVRF